MSLKRNFKAFLPIENIMSTIINEEEYKIKKKRLILDFNRLNITEKRPTY